MSLCGLNVCSNSCSRTEIQALSSMACPALALALCVTSVEETREGLELLSPVEAQSSLDQAQDAGRARRGNGDGRSAACF